MILKKEDVTVQQGYLFSKGGEVLISNDKLYEAYQSAKYLIEMAKEAKRVSFAHKETIDKSEWVKSFSANYSSIEKKEYIEKEKSSKPLTEKLAKEAEIFLRTVRNNTIIDDANNFLSQFDIILTFEEVGVLFDKKPQSFKEEWFVPFKELKEAVMSLVRLELI